jgi:sec-independent protein translocase protein TatA
LVTADPKRPAVNLGPTELIIVLLIVMLLFGAARLPKLARSLGQSASEVRKGMADAELADGWGETTRPDPQPSPGGPPSK